MSFRFLFWMIASCLIISGVAGWLFFGDRDIDPEEQARLAYKVTLESERRAAENGSVEDWTRLARSLATGPQDLRDYAAAMTWYRKAADKGYAPAQVGIGNLYEQGHGVRKDFYRAQEWYRIATRLSQNPEAYFKVGDGYFRGVGVPQDYGQAVKYYTTAARQGHPVAQYIIGSMYEAGWGIPQNLIDAWVWYQRARTKSDQITAYNEEYDVDEAIARIEKSMNQSQLDEARKRLKNVQ